MEEIDIDESDEVSWSGAGLVDELCSSGVVFPRRDGEVRNLRGSNDAASWEGSGEMEELRDLVPGDRMEELVSSGVLDGSGEKLRSGDKEVEFSKALP